MIYAKKCKKMEKYFFWWFNILIFSNLDTQPPTQTARPPYTPPHFFSIFFDIFYFFQVLFLYFMFVYFFIFFERKRWERGKWSGNGVKIGKI